MNDAINDAKILREFQRLSLSGFNHLQSLQSSKNTSPKQKSSKSHLTFNGSSKKRKNNKNGIDKYYHFVYNIDNDKDKSHKNGKYPLINGYDNKTDDDDDDDGNNNFNKPSINDIIDDLKKRKQDRLKISNKAQLNNDNDNDDDNNNNTISLFHRHLSPPSQSQSTSTSSDNIRQSYNTYSRFMLAHIHNNNNKTSNKTQKQLIEIDKYKQLLREKEAEIRRLSQKNLEQEELIKSLQYKLLQKNEQNINNSWNNQNDNDNDYISSDNTLNDLDDKKDYSINIDGDNDDNDDDILSPKPKDVKHLIPTKPPMGLHRRQKSVTQTQTEQSTIENVRWELRAEISKMTSAENEVNRLIQSVGDTSMIHDRLKKIQSAISSHKRKVSALEQTLNIDQFTLMSPNIIGDNDDDMKGIINDLNLNNISSSIAMKERKDFQLMFQEYSKLKLEINELKQEKNEWDNTKKELNAINKRNKNLSAMLDKLSDEKLTLRLQIEDLQTLLNKHNIKYQLQ